jgi:hypothetical protein
MALLGGERPAVRGRLNQWLERRCTRPAASAYASTLTKKNPLLAADWAMTISDTKTRDSSLDRVASGWLRKKRGRCDKVDPEQRALD